MGFFATTRSIYCSRWERPWALLSFQWRSSIDIEEEDESKKDKLNAFFVLFSCGLMFESQATQKLCCRGQSICQIGINWPNKPKM